jgi:hypothetical protein
MPRMTRTIALSLVTTLAAIAACSSDDGGAASSQPSGPTAPAMSTTSPLPSEESPPAVYVAKVKNLLVGLPPTDAEVKAVEADPTQLLPLIDGWMKLPQYQTKMLRFFQLAFQQTQVTVVDFTDQTFPKTTSNNRETTPLIMQNATESFARTVLALVSAGRPLTDALTTRSFMMTPALMEFYAFLDAWQVNDAGTVTDRFRVENPTTSVTVTSVAPIPIADSLDPTSANYMHWYDPNLAKYDAALPGCYTDPVVFDKGAVGFALQRIMQGSLDGRPNPVAGAQACPPVAGATATELAGDDFTTWKMVSTRAPMPPEKATAFYDLPKLRSATELVLEVPRVGFFSTPAFFANWQTNTSNQMRVTTNQTLIVALGAAVDGTDPTHPMTTPGLDTVHAGDPQCVACHQTLDPTRSLLASAFSWSYHNQAETLFSGQKGMFAFQGVTKPVATLDDFGSTLATHPLFAQAWAQKLCFYANSRECDAADPEFQRVVGVFKSSQLSWTALVRELLASPITTNAKPTKTVSDDGEVIAVSRRDHLCAALNARLGFDDICGLESAPAGKAKQIDATIGAIVSGLPSDGYGRGSIAPVLPNDPTLFYRAGTENLCGAISQLVIDPAVATPGAKSWASTSPDAAIADFVQTMMALTPSDARSAPSVTALRGHFDAAVKTGATASDALKSTFVVACLAPSSVAVGL